MIAARGSRVETGHAPSLCARTTAYVVSARRGKPRLYSLASVRGILRRRSDRVRLQALERLRGRVGQRPVRQYLEILRVIVARFVELAHLLRRFGKPEGRVRVVRLVEQGFLIAAVSGEVIPLVEIEVADLHVFCGLVRIVRMELTHVF